MTADGFPTMSIISQGDLAALDQEGYSVIDAVTHVHAPRQGSLASPHAFACMDGKIYWVKRASQEGLVAELVAGRLAGLTQAGPPARIVRVPPEALPLDGSAAHLEGVLVGFEDIRGAINARELSLMGVTGLDPTCVRGDRRALVVAFHTWLNVADAQVLIDMSNGTLATIDFGAAFSGFPQPDPQLIVVDIPGLPADFGHAPELVAAAADRIEAITDAQLVHAVAGIPTGTDWRADGNRRLALAEQIAIRRAKVRSVMERW